MQQSPSGKSARIWRKDAFQAIRRRMDPEVYGGAPLLGFNGMVFKAHGSARERAVASALRVTAEAVQHQVNQIIAREIAAPTRSWPPRKFPFPFRMNTQIQKPARQVQFSRPHLLHHRRRLVCAGKNPDQRRPGKNGGHVGRMDHHAHRHQGTAHRGARTNSPPTWRPRPPQRAMKMAGVTAGPNRP